MRGEDRQRSAWSLFLPVALAVLVGGVLAGLVLRAIDAGSGDGPAAAVDAPATQRDGEASAPAADPAREVDVAAARPEPPAQPAPPLQREPEPEPELHHAAPAPAAAPQLASAQPTVSVLPGPILARRDGAPAACINGTIALRDENGWQQRLENDAPVPCVEGSPAAP